MNDRRIITAGNRIALVLLLIAAVTPARGEPAAERMSRLQTELEWVAGELRTIDLYDDLESREKLYEDVEWLEQQRSSLLRVMPEQIDPAELLGQLRRIAVGEGVELQASQPNRIDHGEYTTVTIRVELEGSGDATQQFIRRVWLSQGVKRVSEIGGDGTARVVDVTAFMIPQRTVEVRSCSIPESSPEASEREAMLRERLISSCASLDAADPNVRAAIHRREQLREWIALTARLTRENSAPLEPQDETESEAELDFDGEMPGDLAGIFADPDPALDEVFANIEAIRADPEPAMDEETPADLEAILGEETPSDLEAILEDPSPAPAERMKWADAKADIRWIATAAEAYAVDHDRYPETSDIDQLANTLAEYVSDAVGTLARTDPWGRRYRWISDGRNYRIVSGGSDGTIEETSLVISDEIHQNDDLVYQNRAFRQAPPP